MAKEAVTDYSTTPINNSDIGGISTLGTSQVLNFDDAFRELMAQLAETNAGTSPWADTMTIGNSGDLTRKFRFNAAGLSAGTTRIYTMPNYDGTLATLAGTETFSNKTFSDMTISGTGTGTFLTITSTDAGATAGPDIELYRNSASPAASDVMGSLLFYGEDSAGNKELYAGIRTTIVDATSASEDADLTLRTVGAGTVADRLHVRLGAYMEGATGGDKGAGTINATAVYKNGNAVTIIPETLIATTSGTTADFTSIPADVRRIVVILTGHSSNGTSVPIIQLGDSGGFETAGYLGSVAGITDGFTSAVNHNTGFHLTSGKGATDVVHGVAILERVGNFTWVLNWNGSMSNQDYAFCAGGTKVLSATLDRLRLTTVSGDTFTAGVVNIDYEV